jgi:dTMP kinase
VSARFIALEGVDGSGKSTQARMLAEALEARGVPCVLTREPGGTPLGEGLRGLLLDGGVPRIGPVAEAYLFAAARAALVEEVVRPALERGEWVVTDRFVDSSLAYQGAAGGLGLDEVWALNAQAVAGCLPDLALVVDVPVDVAAERRCAGPDRIEAQGLGFQERVAEGYRALAARFPERVAMVPGLGAVDEVHAAVMRALERFL